jgi:hypothetical protein
MRAAQNRQNWAFGIFRNTVSPYIADRVYAAAMSLPVNARAFNRFLSRMLCDLDPRLAAIPTDRGACLQPVNARTIYLHATYYLREATRAAKSRSSTKGVKHSAKQFSPYPDWWSDVLKLDSPFYGYPFSAPKRCLQSELHRELLCLLVLECLQNRYPKIARKLTFS